VRRTLLFLCVAAALAGCAKRGPDVTAEAEALAQQGKLEEAAARVELTCAYAPDGESCRASDRRAAELRLQAAEKAITEARFAKAERLLVRALATADAKTAETATQRLAADDLKQGLAYERALGGSDKRAVLATMEAIAATKTPVATQAAAWLAKERPALLIAAANAACTPPHEGSCSEAAAALRAARAAGPEAAAAIALADDEERRVFPLRVTAERFVRGFATARARATLIELCKSSTGDSGPGAIETCAAGGLTPGVQPTAADEDERRQKRTADLTLWRKTMRSIADPALTRALENRRATVEVTGEYTPIDVPRAPAAPAGGHR
jgi:hypothetical protein